MLNHTQHVGLEENAYDHRLSSRNVKVNPFFSFLYWNMEYHIEHHMFPGVPFHALSKLNKLVQDQLPAPYSSVWAVYREMIPTILKQQKESDYHVTPVLPKEKTIVKDTEADNRDEILFEDEQAMWISSIRIDKLPSKGVLPFKYNEINYAIYKLEDRFYVSAAKCTHAGALLSKGIVIDNTIECPAHQGRFDIKTGKATHSPACDHLVTYPTKEKDGYVFIGLPLKS